MDGTKLRNAMTTEPEMDDDAEGTDAEADESGEGLSVEMLETYGPVIEAIEHAAVEIEDVCMSLDAGQLTTGELSPEGEAAFAALSTDLPDTLTTMLVRHLADAPAEDVQLIANHCVDEGYFDSLGADELAGFLTHAPRLASASAE